MLSFLDSSTEDAAELAAGELATALAIALEGALELAGAALEGAGADAAALEGGADAAHWKVEFSTAAALAAAELVALELELVLVDDELHAASVSARAAVPAARSFVVRFTLVTP